MTSTNQYGSTSLFAVNVYFMNGDEMIDTVYSQPITTPDCSSNNMCSNLLSTNLFDYSNSSVLTSDVTWTYYVVQNTFVNENTIGSFEVISGYTKSSYDAQYGDNAHQNVKMFMCLIGPSGSIPTGFTPGSVPGSGSGGGVFKQMLIWNDNTGDPMMITGDMYPIYSGNDVSDSATYTSCSYFYGTDSDGNDDSDATYYYAPTGGDGSNISSTILNGAGGAYNYNTNGFLFGGAGGAPVNTSYEVGDSHHPNSDNQEFIMYNNTKNVDSQTGTTDPAAMILMLPDGNTITLAGSVSNSTTDTGFSTLIVMYCFPN